MTLLSTRNLICNKLIQEYDTLIQPVQTSKSELKGQIDQTQTKLETISFSPSNEIDNAVSSLENNVQSIIPGTDAEDIDETLNFINNCDFLNENEILNNPIALLKGGTSSCITEVSNFITDLSGILPEFDAGELIENILNRFLGTGTGAANPLDITNIVQTADKIINCVSSRCGAEYASVVSTMTNTLGGIYTDLNIVDNPTDPNWGKFNIEQLYSNASLSVQEKSQMNTVVNSITNSKNTVVDSIVGIVTNVKNKGRIIQGLF